MFLEKIVLLISKLFAGEKTPLFAMHLRTAHDCTCSTIIPTLFQTWRARTEFELKNVEAHIMYGAVPKTCPIFPSNKGEKLNY